LTIDNNAINFIFKVFVALPELSLHKNEKATLALPDLWKSS